MRRRSALPVILAMGTFVASGSLVLGQSTAAREMADSAYALVDRDAALAKEVALKAISMAKLASDRGSEHDGLNALRYAHFLSGEYSACLERSMEALNLARGMGSERAMGDDHGWIATVLMETGRQTEAYAHAQQAMVHMRLSKDSTAIANGLCDMSNAIRTAGKEQEAMVVLREAISIYVAIGDPSGEAFANGLLGNLLVERKQWSDAWPFLNKAYRHTSEHGTDLEKAWLERDLATSALNMGRTADAKRYLADAENRLNKLNALREMPEVQRVRMELLQREGDLVGALGTARSLMRMKDSLNKADLTERLAQALTGADVLAVQEQLGALSVEQRLAEQRINEADVRIGRWRMAGVGASVLLLIILVLHLGLVRKHRSVRVELERTADQLEELRGHRIPRAGELPV
ncbi:MAG: hypothetical protein IPI81_03980 [Flavobacteriales bacterium]|nr:hypothetical protein [Flavobacteriales bacterium]MCC6937605.1 hypothetical protein [Flavobacteriales bacterium]